MLMIACVAIVMHAWAIDVPVVSSTNTTDGAKWYKIRNTRLTSNGGPNYMQATGYGATPVSEAGSSTDEAQLWCFVGDNTDGYTLYNKAYLDEGARLIPTDIPLPPNPAEWEQGYLKIVKPADNDWSGKWFIDLSKDKADEFGLYYLPGSRANYIHGQDANPYSLLLYHFEDWGSFFAFEAYTPDDNLNELITLVEAALQSAIIGDGYFQYPAQAKADLEEALADAETAKENAVSLEDFNTAYIALNEAFETFKASRNNYEPLVELLDLSKKLLDYPSVAQLFPNQQATFTDAYEAAVNVVENVQTELAESTYETLLAAREVFLAAIYSETIIPSTDTGEDAVWYRFKNLRFGMPVRYLSAYGYDQELHVATFGETKEDLMWCFIGDFAAGFTMYNKKYLDDGSRLVINNGRPELRTSTFEWDGTWKLDISRMQEFDQIGFSFDLGSGMSYFHRNEGDAIVFYNFNDNGSFFDLPERVTTETGIKAAGSNGIAVYSSNNAIVVEGAQGIIRLTSLSGLATKIDAKPQTVIPVANTGLYVVTANGVSVKVLVK
jgi:hypothetical protein